MREQSPTYEDIKGSSDSNAMAEMRVVVDELCRQNQTSEEKVLNIQQRQQEVNTTKDA